jgi:hypothetical protein
VELVGGAGVSNLPKVAAAIVAGVGRNCQATATAIQSPESSTGERERERVRAGLGQFDRPRPEPAGLAEPGGLAGPAGLLDQQARWTRLVLPIVSKTKL